jgi:hypothetical protein
MFRGSDHCRRASEQGAQLQALAAALLEGTDVAAWLGEPTERQGCQPGARDLAPREIGRALSYSGR